MKIPFVKMHGTGNDFVVFDATRKKLDLTAERVRKIADRHFGIGCDQLLVIEPPRDKVADYRYRIYNADGGEVGQCGNGLRCIARFIHDRGLSGKTELTLETLGGRVRSRLESDGQVTVELGAPRFEPAEIPFEAAAREPLYGLDVGKRHVRLSVLSMGNPHAVQVVSDIDQAPVTSEGPLIESHSRFPQRANAGYMQILGRKHFRLRVFERGAGETLACGSGACAAMVAGRQQGLLDDKVEVQLRCGTLWVSWAGEGQSVWLTGPAATVFEGTIALENL